MNKLLTWLAVVGLWLVYYAALLVSIVIGSGLVTWVVMVFPVTLGIVTGWTIDYVQVAVITYVFVFGMLIVLTAITLLRRNKTLKSQRNELQAELSVQRSPERSPAASRSKQSTAEPRPGTSPQS